MEHGLAADVFGNHLDADFHRAAAGKVHCGQKGHQFADMDWLAEGNLVDAHRHHVAPGVATCTGVGRLVEQFQDGAAVHVAGEIGGVGRHQHCHAELVGGQVHGCNQYKWLVEY